MKSPMFERLITEIRNHGPVVGCTVGDGVLTQNAAVNDGNNFFVPERHKVAPGLSASTTALTSLRFLGGS
jgi:hypothetical protein